MKKRVSIITWLGNTTLNYGSALQATAMQELLRKEDCYPTTIDFMYLGKTKKEIANALLENGIQYAKTYFKFQQWYKKYMKLSPVCYYDDDIVEYAKNNSDILLCGSDCIWGGTYTSSPKFFWDYEELGKIPHVAYAAGRDKDGIIYDMKGVKEKFTAISVREQDSVEKLRNKHVDAVRVLDPTLAVDESFWTSKIISDEKQEKYILCYILSKVEYQKDIINEIKKKNNIKKVVYIKTDFIDKMCNEIYSDYSGEEYKSIVGPREFLTLFRNAAAVCTDSYHGVCFSVVFRKDFYILNPSRKTGIIKDYRFESIQECLNISKRYVNCISDIASLDKIDWNEVEKHLSYERQKSRCFLHNAMEKIRG